MDSSLSRVTAGRQNGPQGLVEMTLKLLLFLGQRTSELSSALVGPLMGITSVLWLMMRNNAAISPKASWMLVSLSCLSVQLRSTYANLGFSVGGHF